MHVYDIEGDAERTTNVRVEFKQVTPFEESFPLASETPVETTPCIVLRASK